MAEDWAADVKKYDASADDGIIAGIVRYCGIALRNRDSSLVSMSDPTETARVRENFLKKKLALTDSDDVLDRAIAEVGERMKADRTKNRVTVYYLLAQAFGMLGVFAPKEKAAASSGSATGAGTAAAAGAGTAALSLASLGGEDDKPAATPVSNAAPPPPPATDTSPGIGAAGLAAAGAVGGAAAASASSPPPVAAPPAPAPEPARLADAPPPAATYDDDSEGGGMGWLWWLLLALALIALLWWLFFRQPANDTAADTAASGAPVEEVAPAPTDGAATASGTDLSTAPAEGTVTIPTGAGVTSELRAGKPVVKVYFDTAKTDVAPAFADAAGGLKAWLAANPGSSLAVSGYNDSTGNAAANAELSKNRAQAVQAALVAAGIAEGSVELVKPDATTAGTGDDAAARRVEVVVR